MGRFGTIDPEVRAQHEAAHQRRLAFCKELDKTAWALREEMSYDGDEGEPGRWLKYVGQIWSNYPWLYIDFRVKGSMPLSDLLKVEARFRSICEAQEYRAEYLNTTLTINGRRIPMLRCRLIYREDLKR